MELCSKLCNGFQQLSIIAKSAVLNVWLGPKCASEMYTSKTKNYLLKSFVYNSGTCFDRDSKKCYRFYWYSVCIFSTQTSPASVGKKWLSNLLFAVVEKSNGALVEAFVPNLFKVNNENTRATVKSL